MDRRDGGRTYRFEAEGSILSGMGGRNLRQAHRPNLYEPVRSGVLRSRAARGRHRQASRPSRRAEAAGGLGPPGHPRERARPSRGAGRRALGRGTAGPGPEHHSDLRLAPAQGAWTRPHRVAPTGLSAEARSGGAGRCPVRDVAAGRDQGPPGRSAHRRGHPRRCAGIVARPGSGRSGRAAVTSLAEATRLDDLRLQAQEERVSGASGGRRSRSSDRRAGGCAGAPPTAGEPVGAADAGLLPGRPSGRCVGGLPARERGPCR